MGGPSQKPWKSSDLASDGGFVLARSVTEPFAGRDSGGVLCRYLLNDKVMASLRYRHVERKSRCRYKGVISNPTTWDTRNFKTQYQLRQEFSGRL